MATFPSSGNSVHSASDINPANAPWKKPIAFTVLVKDTEQTATLVEIVDNPLYNEFVLRFSDGYQDHFILPEETDHVLPGKGKAGQPYAAAVQEDMLMLGLLTDNENVWCLRYPVDGRLTNVWIRENGNEAEKSFSVYYLGDYYFHVHYKDGKWRSETTRQIDPQPVDQELAEAVCRLLEKEYLIHLL